MSPGPRADDFKTALDPDSSLDDRGDAIQRLMTQSWAEGWTACEETYTAALKDAGLLLPTPIERPN